METNASPALSDWCIFDAKDVVRIAIILCLCLDVSKDKRELSPLDLLGRQTVTKHLGNTESLFD